MHFSPGVGLWNFLNDSHNLSTFQVCFSLRSIFLIETKKCNNKRIQILLKKLCHKLNKQLLPPIFINQLKLIFKFQIMKSRPIKAKVRFKDNLNVSWEMRGKGELFQRNAAVEKSGIYQLTLEQKVPWDKIHRTWHLKGI